MLMLNTMIKAFEFSGSVLSSASSMWHISHHVKVAGISSVAKGHCITIHVAVSSWNGSNREWEDPLT